MTVVGCVVAEGGESELAAAAADGKPAAAAAGVCARSSPLAEGCADMSRRCAHSRCDDG